MSNANLARLCYATVGGSIGAIIGVPASYYFQPIGIRLKSIGAYIERTREIMTDYVDGTDSAGLGTTLIISVCASSFLGVLVASFIFSRKQSKQIQPQIASIPND